MFRLQQALGVDGLCGRGVKGDGQGAGFGLGFDAAATEQQQRVLRLGQLGGGFVQRRAGRGRAGQLHARAHLHVVGRGGDDVQRQLDMHRARALAVEHGEGAGQHGRQFLDAHQRVAEGADAGDHGALVRQLVQVAVAVGQARAFVDAADHQHGDGVGVGLAHGGEDVGHARAGDDEAHARLAGDARVAVGHEAGALFVARGDVADAAVGQAAVQLDGVYAGDAEDGIDAPGFELLDEEFAAGGHGSSLEFVGEVVVNHAKGRGDQLAAPFCLAQGLVRPRRRQLPGGATAG